MKLRISLISFALLAFPFCMQAAAVSPATLDLVGNRGETVDSSFTVINAQSTDQTYFFDTLSFSAKDNSGEPQFANKKTTDELAKWIQFNSDQIVVPAQSKADIPFSIHIPADASSGSFQSAITVSGAPSEIVATNGAVVEAKTAILVFLTVNGDTIKKAALLDFTSNAQKMQSNLNQTLTFRIQNQGNVYFVPTGRVEMRDMFGRLLYQTIVNEDKSRVLPNLTRSFTTSVIDQSKGWITTIQNQASIFAMGPITTTLHLNPGDGFQPIQSTSSFWYVPYQLLATLLVAIAILLLGYYSLSKRKRK